MLKKSALLGTSAVLTLALAAPAFAQSGTVDEIFTTATKRETTLQQTPVSVAVTSSDTIEKANIIDVSDLQSVVPSLRINTLQASQNTNFEIRGFGNGANNAGIEPSVGVFVDGVYRSRSAASIGDLPKLERVEVLSGPQSTLFGKNASAGVISVVTAKPKFETAGHFELGLGNYNLTTAKAYITGSLAGMDNVAYSLGGGVTKRDGYVESAIGLDDVNDRNRYNLRGQMLIEPTDNVSVRLIADFSKLDENCCHVSNFTESGATAAIGAIDGDFTDRDIADATNPFAYVAYQNTDSVNKIDDAGISAHIDVAFETFDLTSITSYRQNSSYYKTDADYSLNESLEVASDQELSTLTQEVRLTSNTPDAKFDWMVGAFLFDEDVTQIGGLEYGADLRAYIDLLAGGAATLGGIEALHGIAPGTFFGDQIETVETFTQDDLAYSVFGTLDFHVNDRLTLTGGLNFTSDEKHVTGKTVNNDAFSAIDFATTPTVFGISFVDYNIAVAAGMTPDAASIAFLQTNAAATYAAIEAGVNDAISDLRALQFQPQFLSFPNSVEDGETNDEKLTYALRAAYEVDDSLNMYASYATGFKSSSWNLSRDSRPFSADAASLTAAGLTLANQSYSGRLAEPEFAKVFEVGVKKSFDRGYVNAAAFTQSIEDFQGNIFVGTSFTLTNAGETQVNGIELDSSFNVTDNFNIKAAVTALDPEYTDYQNAPGCGGTVVDLTGTKPGNISELSVSIAGTYNHEFDNGMKGYLRGDYQHESDTEYGNTISSDCYTSLGITTYQAPDYDQRGQDLVNLSAGLTLENGLGIQVWGRNVTNDEYAGSQFPGVAQTGVINGYPNQPATYGVNVRKDF